MFDPAALRDAQAWGKQALALTQDATSILNSVIGLAGNFGRYATGPIRPGITSEADAIAQGAAARAAVTAAVAALFATVRATGDVPSAIKAVLDAAAAAQPSPGDRMRCCAMLATVPGATQVAVCCRRLSVVALAVASSAYLPASYDEARAALSQVADALDAEITAAGDAGDDDTWTALRTLRVAVLADLTTRGASLAPLRTFMFQDNLPAEVVAQMIYRDATRADELVARLPDLPHPAFMPITFQALAR